MYLPADMPGGGAGLAGLPMPCGDLSCYLVPNTAPYIKLAVMPRLVFGYPTYTTTAQPGTLSVPLSVAPHTPTLQVPGSALSMAAALQVTANAAPVGYPGQHAAPAAAMLTSMPGQKTNSIGSFHHCTGAIDIQSGGSLQTTQLTQITTEGTLAHPTHFHNGISQFTNLGTHPTGTSPQLPRTCGGLKRKVWDDNISDSGDSSGKLDSLSESEREFYCKKLHCKVCRVTLNAPAQAKQHYEGKTHAKRVKLHTEGQPEKKAATDQAGSDGGTGAESRTTPAPTKDINPEIYCKVCAVSFNSSKQAQQHYGGKNHAKKLRATRRLTGHRSSRNSRYSFRLTCVVCKLRLANKEELDVHIQQSGHSVGNAMTPCDVRWAGPGLITGH